MEDREFLGQDLAGRHALGELWRDVASLPRKDHEPSIGSSGRPVKMLRPPLGMTRPLTLAALAVPELCDTGYGDDGEAEQEDEVRAAGGQEFR